MAGGHFNSFRDARGSEGGEVVALIITRVKITFPISFETMPESGGRWAGGMENPTVTMMASFCAHARYPPGISRGWLGFVGRGGDGEKHFSAGGGMELHRIHIKI